MSHFSDIGFAFKNIEEFQAFCEQVVNRGQPLTSPLGYYVRWQAGAGVELWIQANQTKQLVGCSPHFVGSGEMRVCVTQTFRHPERPMDGSLYAWADPQDDANPYSGKFALAVDLPDFDRVEDRLIQNPTVTLQIAAFADILRCFPSEAAFTAEQSEMAPEAFRPGWRKGERPGEPRPEAIFSGRIRQAEQRVNPATGQPFLYALVQTLGGTIDVVADPATTDGEPVVEGILAGTFYLSARVISPLPAFPPQSTFRRTRS